ncbi:dapper homolog 2 [Esox lucius]|uniref:Dishevelled-binding antagonist of beta-catenin 2 n=1 Tax=Esox lucius TaxID=8010 RepID=A0A3P8ZWJ6_ESOLU|nr:dapper homolog 2 [Esox lucius]
MAAGIDRGRVGERLQAALAGLQELHFLKEKQCNMVNWALRMDREVSGDSTETITDGRSPVTEELRLEATLSALKQQLSRLRRQDAGLKTHLQQLDQQISELKLDVGKASTEQQESDSRPSSGFYDLSDGGSCSLSNSCTSVYSECVSSSSQTSLLPPNGSSESHTHSAAAQPTEKSRRRSADETTTLPNPPRVTGLHLGSSRLRTGAAATGWARQRPVSTGDLERMMTPGLSKSKYVDVKKSPLCSNIRSSSTVDHKYQSNLVSRNGAEIYLYPSPLHVVALQSPIFSLGEEPTVPDALGSPSDAVLETVQTGRVEGTDAKPLGYIDKLLQRSVSKMNVPTELNRDAIQIPKNCLPRNEVGTVVQGPPPQAVIMSRSDVRPVDKQRQSRMHIGEEPANDVNLTQQALGAAFLQTSYRYSYPTAVREYSRGVYTASKTNVVKVLSSGVKERGNPGMCHVEVPGGEFDRKQSNSRLGSGFMGVAHSSNTEEAQGPEKERHLSDFVHAQFVPAGSQQVKVRPAEPKTKAVRLRRKSFEKPSCAMRLQPQGHSSNERPREASVEARVERELPGRTCQSQRPASCLVKECGHSGSESSLCGSTFSYAKPQVHAQPLTIPASKSTKVRRPHYSESDQPPLDQRKRKQGTPKWPSDIEMFQAMCAQQVNGQRRVVQNGGPESRLSMGRGLSARPHTTHWGGVEPHRAPRSSVSSSSYFSQHNTRYPPAPYPVSTRNSSTCESEYSADCASLFHSTIAESSEGELSDNTINRFGDSESSQSDSQSHSDSCSSLSLDEGSQEEGGFVWAEATLGPVAAGLPLQQLPHPEPPGCRIKASRALKKKIRRFQPASMKVMTLV